MTTQQLAIIAIALIVGWNVYLGVVVWLLCRNQEAHVAEHRAFHDSKFKAYAGRRFPLNGRDMTARAKPEAHGACVHY